MIKILLICLRYSDREVRCSIKWTGDNCSSLAWVRKRMCSSISAQRAFMAESWLSTLANIHTVEANHKAGKDMGDIDGLSRLHSTDFDPKYSLHRYMSPNVNKLFTFCDPTKDDDNTQPSLAQHGELMQILSEIIDRK